MNIINSLLRHCALTLKARLNRTASCGKHLACVSVSLLVMTVHPANAQSTIRTVTPPVEYTPFEVVVQSSKRYCFDPSFPLFGEVRYATSTVSVVLTHLNSPLLERGRWVTCGQERKFTLPGLPSGQQTIKIDVTDGIDFQTGTALVSETITATIEVAAFSTTSTLVNFWTGTFTPGLGGARGFRLTPSRFSVWNTEWDWLEVGDSEKNYTFKGFQFAEADRLPDALARIYSVTYPDPYRGSFWTVDKAVAQRLAGEWGRQIDGFPSPLAVGRLTSGACPIGMSPVYQTFHIDPARVIQEAA